ncbi:helix-turn-helix domain-containing protein [Saccharopolyspora sp. 6T]|uniref:helix-turn-helix domain-containing protein n=1 Tax=Saccharopolyspora sp. 6T TaxID=2877238 RepID=UPI001CD30266|nr:helix-turn-helix domain-containing protein [Saccharopolyspora sp. 6T]MCA1185794.1 helix-turn-helix domain-containing protein [Saccharopolyspora sp. 6T]
MTSIITDPNQVQPQALGVKAAARYLGITDKQLRRLLATREIPSRNTGRAYIISIKALDDYLAGADDPIRHPDSA